MENFKKEYRDLEMRILSELRKRINNSNVYSKHVTHEKCIEVDVFDYTELAIVDDKLTFLDDKGYQYSLWNGDCNIEDLIDILNKTK